MSENGAYSKIKTILKSRKVIISVSVVATVCIAAVIFGAAQLPKGDKIAHGVVMDGKNLGGMTVSEASAALSDSKYYDGKDFVLVSGEERSQVNGEDISLGTDVPASADAAYMAGRGKGLISNIIECIKLRYSDGNIAPVPLVDTDALDSVIYELGVRKNGEMQPAAVRESEGDTVAILPPSAGQGKDVSDSRAEVLAALRKDMQEIELELPISDPGDMTAEQVYAVVYQPSQDAEYKLEGKELYVVDEVVGRDTDKAEIEKQLSKFNAGEVIVVSVTRLEPEKTAASLRDGLFGAELSSYSSTYSTAAANRASNVAHAAASVNGTILLPGDTFSYNSVIGNPSLANGYKVAPVFENGKTSEGVGGGVCQVSSTIYSAVLYANLEIVERRNHSLTVAYVPKGQDATVAYGAIDFKFRNNTAMPVRIDASASGGKCVVRVVGTMVDPSQSVKIEHTIAATNEPSVNETRDAEMPEGTRKVTSTGKTGYVIDSVRIVSRNGEVVKTEKLGRSTYKMVPTEVTVGTKPKATPEPTPVATPETIPEHPAEETAVLPHTPAEPAPESEQE